MGRAFDDLKPGRRDLDRMDRAFRMYADWRDYGLPERGGSRDQPAVWHHAVGAVKAGIAAADASEAGAGA